MRLLLDTCTFLWVIEGSEALSERAVELFRDPANEVLVSTASFWEILVKHRLGRLVLPEPAGRFLREERERHRIATLAIEEDAVLQLPKLPDHHRDPFDRILICQAIEHEATLLTPDEAIARYPVRVLW